MNRCTPNPISLALFVTTHFRIFGQDANEQKRNMYGQLESTASKRRGKELYPFLSFVSGGCLYYLQAMPPTNYQYKTPTHKHSFIIHHRGRTLRRHLPLLLAGHTFRTDMHTNLSDIFHISRLHVWLRTTPAYLATSRSTQMARPGTESFTSITIPYVRFKVRL